DRSGPDLELIPALAAARTLSEALRREQGVHLVVALSSLRPAANATLAESGVVDLIMGGLDPNLATGRVLILGQAAMLSTLPYGREVGRTRLVVRDGNLLLADLSPLATLPAETELLQQQLDALAKAGGTTDLEALARRFTPGHEPDFIDRFSALEENREFIASHQDYAGSYIEHLAAAPPPVPPEHPVLAALGRLGPAIHDAYGRITRPVAEPPEGTPLIPVPEDCSACHSSQVRFWEGTAHARAYADLVALDRGRDPTCLVCHAAAFGVPGGWSDPRQDAPRGAVTCHSCHKATAVHSSSRVYVLDSSQLVGSGEQMDCTGCHQEQRSPGFDRLEALPGMSCPPMRDDEPAIILARERAVEALKGRAARGEAEPLDDYLLARGLVGLGREEGFRLLRDSAQANQDNVRQAIESARLFDAHLRSREAIEVLRGYLAEHTGDPDVNLEHVRMMLEARDPQVRDPQQALTQLRLLTGSLESDDSRLIDFQLLEADALAALGQQEQAVSLLQDLRGRHPRDDRVTARLRRYAPER
ncbi:MAG TPA: cytochrome c family protein, partial [Planctomycetota bacterium]|nr:cytochrome c family protein [Planctomycetota bacterium]